MHGELADLEIAGLHLAMTHYPDIARGLVASGDYDLVCYGHDHLACDEVLGSSRLLNPGELMGRLGPSTFVILDADSRVAEQVEVENPHSI